MKRLPLRVGVVGGGVAGLQAARELCAAGATVQIYDQGRAPGGSVATRRDNGWSFDHGAQYFTARDRGFGQAVVEWCRLGVASHWPGPFRAVQRGVFGPDPRQGRERYCGVPGMSAICHALAAGLPTRSGIRITALAQDHAGSWLHAGTLDPFGPFDEVVLALPPPHAAALLPGGDALAAELAAIAMAPCLALMVVFDELPECATGGLFVDDDDLAWACHDGGKPGRSGAPSFVLHGTAAFSARHVDAGAAEWEPLLLHAFARAIDRPLPRVVHLSAHRWRCAQPVAEHDAGCRRDAARRLTLAGDAWTGGRVEGSYLSGKAAAAAILAADT